MPSPCLLPPTPLPLRLPPRRPPPAIDRGGEVPVLYFTAEDGVQYAAYADGAVVQVRATARATARAGLLLHKTLQ